MSYQFGSSAQPMPKGIISPLVQAVSIETPVVTAEHYPTYKVTQPDQGFNYENYDYSTKLYDYCFHTTPYFLILLYVTSVLLIIIGLIDTILCSKSAVTYQVCYAKSA